MDDEARFAELAARTRAAMAEHRVPGVALGVWSAGREYAVGLGATNVENPLAVTPDTLFQIGSITKTMTALALLRLRDAGRLDLDAPVSAYLPGFSMKDPEAARKTTARVLLNHSGGWVGDYFDDFGNGDDALARMVEAVGRLPQVTPPGLCFSYNNAGFNLASRLLEVLSGKPYERAMQELVFDPIGLSNSFFYPDDSLITRRVASGHEYSDGATRVLREWAIGRAGNGVGGGLQSIRDLLKYGRFQLRSGLDDEGARVVDAATIEEMRAPALGAGARGSVGLSWFVRDSGPVRAVYHAGATNGQEAFLCFFPGRDLAAAVLTNDDAGGEITGSLRPWVLDLWFGAADPVIPRLDASDADLDAVCGWYEQPLSAFRLERRGAELWYLEERRGGFPRPDSPPGPAYPPMRAELLTEDRIRILDGPKAGNVGDFLRGGDGKIRLLRIGGRAIPRVRTGA